ncbi:hypothetical protein LUZ60_007281 [Juncus effusus]|nr:hypothetical protein LUZ60_007281 [Juncus effusus]
MAKEEELETVRKSHRLTTAAALAIPPSFAVGAQVEVRTDAEGFIGSWFEAVVTDHLIKSGRVLYRIKYLTLMKDDEPDLPEIEDVEVDDVRPVAPRRLNLTEGEEISDPGFEMHELVEAYHNEGWWYGVISGLRNAVTGKYRVSFPFSREVIDFPPSEIRPQLNFINGNWFPLKPKPQKSLYKTGAKVEAVKISEKYGHSWFPATVEKILSDNNFLIKYENENYLPYGHLTEIVDFYSLRPLFDRNPKSYKLEVNSDVEVFHRGAWTNGVVTSVLSDASYLVRVCESDDVAPVLVYEEFVRLRLQWDGKKWSKFRILGKRGRSAVKDRSASAKKKKNDNSVSPSSETSVLLSGLKKNKKKKNDNSVSPSSETNVLLSAFKKNKTKKNDISISPSGKTSVLLSGSKNHSVSANKNGNCMYYKRTKNAVSKYPRSKLRNGFDSSPSSVNMKTGKDKSKEATESINSPADAADISKGKMVNLQNGGQEQTINLIPAPPNPNPNEVSDPLNPNPNQVSTPLNPKPNQVSTPLNPNPNQVSTPLNPNPNPNQISTPPNPNPNQVSAALNPNPSESSPSSSVSGNIILPFEWRSPVWNSVHALDVFRKTPQKPHFANLQKCCNKEELEGRALGQMVTYSNLAVSINILSLDAELAEFNSKLQVLDSLQQDGFETDPLRTRLTAMLELKKEICESSLKRKELETELSQRYEDYGEILGNVDRVSAELAELRERERRLKERRERELEKAAGTGDRISRLESEIGGLDRNDEVVREKFGSLCGN